MLEAACQPAHNASPACVACQCAFLDCRAVQVHACTVPWTRSAYPPSEPTVAKMPGLFGWKDIALTDLTLLSGVLHTHTRLSWLHRGPDILDPCSLGICAC